MMQPAGFRGAIFDVDGVLVDSPHELAWRESFRALMEGGWREIRDQTSWTAERFTPAVYQQVMAGRPRMAGARAAMEYFGVPDIDARVEQYAAAKQEHVVKLIEEGRFMAFPDALRFILVVKASGIPVAAASSSKNAKLFLERIRLDLFAAEQRLDYGFIRPGMTLAELFDADISGRDFPRGKPDPTIFLTAAEELGVSPADCFVAEDASTGIQAAKAGGMAGLGVARLDDRDLLLEAGADLVVTTLDDVSLRALAEGRLEERRAAAEIRRRHTQRPPSVWTLAYDSFDPARQGLREALCALGNGYFVTRGAAGGRRRRRQLPGHLRRRPLRPGHDRDRRADGGERGSGQRPQLVTAAVPAGRRGMVRRPRGPRSANTGLSWTCAGEHSPGT
jgi:beta-phosphoglucomutase-like phosphatase (HAD superfamily)